MRRKRKRRAVAGRAGFVASVAMALAGVLTGALSVYVGQQGASVRAERARLADLPLRETPLTLANAAFDARARIVGELMDAAATDEHRVTTALKTAARSEFRFAAPVMKSDLPKIIIIFDDMGPDKGAYETVAALPGPLTLSFLPYADGLQSLVDRASARGDAVMLHLPMAPVGAADPGPQHLSREMTGASLLSTLKWNLDRFEGYVGVNNHMGSSFTQDAAAMKTVLSVLKQRGLFFLDSLTTPESQATAAGRAIGATVYRRDVFLDPDLDRETVFKQLELVERIARETGYAVAICHPRPETIAALGPWLTSAPARGFELATIETLVQLERVLHEKDRASASRS